MVLEFALKNPMHTQHRNFNYSNNISVGVYVAAGSRNEDLESSGSAYLLEKMLLRGTTSQSKS